MGKVRVLTASDVREALPMKKAIKGMKAAYRAFSTGEATVPLRSRLSVPHNDGLVLFMPASLAAEGGHQLAIKTVTVFPQNYEENRPVVQASVLVIDGETGETKALIEGSTLTAIRTGAGAGAATDLLARPDAKILGMIGSGVQALAGIEAVCAIRDIEEIRVYSRTQMKTKQFVEKLVARKDLPDNIIAMNSAAAAVREADIVYTATTSAEPVFNGDDLVKGAHINAVGSYTPAMQEVDPKTLNRSLVFVDSMESMLAEVGDFLVPMESGEYDFDDIQGEIGELAAGAVRGRVREDQITFFKSVGIAVQDVVAAHIALQNAESREIGQLVDF